MADRDYSYDDYERMAAQTHPDILPVNVQYLGNLTERAEESVRIVDAFHAEQNRTVIQRIGMAALVTVTVEAGYELVLKNVAPAPVSLDKYIIGAGVGYAACQGLRALFLKAKMRVVSGAAREHHQIMAGFHKTAHGRAVEMGLIQSEE